MRRAEDGFTLVELLVVLITLAILVVIGVSSYLGFQTRSRDAAAKSALRQALPAVHGFQTDYGTWSGMTIAQLEAEYDQGLAGLTILSSDDAGYCLRSVSGDRTWFAGGPPLAISSTSCA